MQRNGGLESAVAHDGPSQCFTPAGLRVLAVDDDKTCLKVISKMLEQCNYEGVSLCVPFRCTRSLRLANLLSSNAASADAMVACPRHEIV